MNGSIVRHIWFLLPLSFTMVGCGGSLPSDKSVDLAAARALSDSVMTALMQGQFDVVFDRMDPSFLTTLDRSRANAAIQKLFDYCGQPVGLQFDRDEARYMTSTAYASRPIRRFKYASTPTRQGKDACIWSVDIMNTEAGLRVAYVRAGHRLDATP